MIEPTPACSSCQHSWTCFTNPIRSLPSGYEKLKYVFSSQLWERASNPTVCQMHKMLKPCSAIVACLFFPRAKLEISRSLGVDVSCVVYLETWLPSSKVPRYIETSLNGRVLVIPSTSLTEPISCAYFFESFFLNISKITKVSAPRSCEHNPLYPKCSVWNVNFRSRGNSYLWRVCDKVTVSP